MSVIVRIENAYSDGHESTKEVRLSEPTGNLDAWWEDWVWPETGDGHGKEHEDLGCCYTATIIASDRPQSDHLVGETFEWASS